MTVTMIRLGNLPRDQWHILAELHAHPTGVPATKFADVVMDLLSLETADLVRCYRDSRLAHLREHSDLTTLLVRTTPAADIYAAAAARYITALEWLGTRRTTFAAFCTATALDLGDLIELRDHVLIETTYEDGRPAQVATGRSRSTDLFLAVTRKGHTYAAR